MFIYINIFFNNNNKIVDDDSNWFKLFLFFHSREYNERSANCLCCKSLQKACGLLHFKKSQERLVILILSKKIVILILSRIVQPYCLHEVVLWKLQPEETDSVTVSVKWPGSLLILFTFKECLCYSVCYEGWVVLVCCDHLCSESFTFCCQTVSSWFPLD